jgi:hypothetical protein
MRMANGEWHFCETNPIFAGSLRIRDAHWRFYFGETN